MRTRDPPPPKIGAGHAQAMFRLGLAELRQAVYPESNVAAPTQYGLYGTRTPGEVMQERSGESGRGDPDERPSSVLSPYEPQRQPDAEPGQPDRQGAERKAPQQPEPELDKED